MPQNFFCTNYHFLAIANFLYHWHSEIPQKVVLYDCPDCSFQSVDCETLLSHSMNEHFDAEQYEASLANTSTSNKTNPNTTSQFRQGTPRNAKNPHIPNVEITPINTKSPINQIKVNSID